MPKARLKLSLALAAAVGISAGAAYATDEIVDRRGWPLVAADRDGDCRASVRGNGLFYKISGSGLPPGGAVAFHLENEEITPVEYRDRADSAGNWTRYYLPFLWHHRGGTVDVRIATARCNLAVSFDWTRTDPNR